MDESLAPLQWLDVLLPVVRRSGARDRVCFADLTGGREDPVMGLDCPHPLLALSFELLATHILQIAYPPPDERTWRQRLFDPPSPAALRDALAPYREAFVLWGSDTPFLQVKPLSAWTPDPQPLGSLLPDVPTEEARSNNEDFFVKKKEGGCFSSAFVAPMLYLTNQILTQDKGHYYNIPQGAFCPVYQVRGNCLWENLWLNVLTTGSPIFYGARWPVPFDGTVFPWLREDLRNLKTTWASEEKDKNIPYSDEEEEGGEFDEEEDNKSNRIKKEKINTIRVKAADRHPAGFVLPRRYFLSHPCRGVCNFLGEEGVFFEKYNRWPHGLSYDPEGWNMPSISSIEERDAHGSLKKRKFYSASTPLRLEDWLSPALGHQPEPPQGKSCKIIHPAPVVKALAGRMGDLVDAFEEEEGAQAKIVSAHTPELPFSIKVMTLFSFNKKAVDGLSERSLPLYSVAGDARKRVGSDASHLASEVAKVAGILADHAVTALKVDGVKRGGKQKKKPKVAIQLSDALMRSLEGPVLAALPQIIESLRAPDPDVARAAVRDALLQQARKKALDLFDEAFPLAFPDASARAIALARRALVKDLQEIVPGPAEEEGGFALMSSEGVKYLIFSKEESASTTLPVLKAWHARLADDRRARAVLRRAQSVDDVWPEEAFSRLRLDLLPLASFSDEALARAAVAVAEVNKDDKASLARRAASPGVRGKPVVSSDRLRLLLGSEDPDEFLRLLRGIIDQIDRQVNVAALADLVLSWEHPNGRLWARRTVFLDYYEAAPADA